MFIRRAVPKALQDLLASSLQNMTRVRDAFEAEVGQLVGTSKFAKKISNSTRGDPVIVALIGTFVVKMADEAVSRASKPEVSAVSPFLHSSEPDNSFSEGGKDRSKSSRKNSGRTRRCCKLSRASSIGDPLYLAKPLNGRDVSRFSDKTWQADNVPKLPALQVANSHLGKVLSYWTYSLAKTSQRHNKKLAASMGKYARRRESII